MRSACRDRVGTLPDNAASLNIFHLLNMRKNPPETSRRAQPRQIRIPGMMRQHVSSSEEDATLIV
jgi:hypothetical protein